MTARCNCASGATNGDAAIGAFCVMKGSTRTLLAACAAAPTALSAECMCGSSDNSKGTNTGYANTKVCVKGADASTAGAFSTTVAQCTASATDKMAATCSCVAGQNGDAAIGAFCVDKSGTRTLLAACAAGSALSA